MTTHNTLSTLLRLLVALWTVNLAQAEQASIYGFRGGDPHVTTWGGTHFELDEVAEGDFVLFQSNTKKVQVQIRTKLDEIDDYWSYIETAVLQVGDHTIQIMGGTASTRYWVDGQERRWMRSEEALEIQLGELQCHFHQLDDAYLQITVRLDDTTTITLEAFQQFVSVKLDAQQMAEDAAGLLGSFPDGIKVGRDRMTMFDNEDALAEEWRLSASESLFLEERPHSHSYPSKDDLELAKTVNRMLASRPKSI